jgi:hypothetical protein
MRSACNPIAQIVCFKEDETDAQNQILRKLIQLGVNPEQDWPNDWMIYQLAVASGKVNMGLELLRHAPDHEIQGPRGGKSLSHMFRLLQDLPSEKAFDFAKKHEVRTGIEKIIRELTQRGAKPVNEYMPCEQEIAMILGDAPF